VEPPIGFRAIQAADLAHWDGTAGDPAAQMFIADLKTVLGAPLARSDQRSGDLETRKIAEGFSLARTLGGGWRKLALAAGVAVALFTGWQFWLEPRQKIQTPPPSLMSLAI